MESQDAGISDCARGRRDAFKLRSVDVSARTGAKPESKKARWPTARTSADADGRPRGHGALQAWEIVAQTTGNWPIMSDTFRNERYKCAPDGSGWRCDSWIDVCKS